MHPILTIFCPFTRRWAIDGWIEQLEKVAHDPALTNLCFIIDCNEPYIQNELKKYAERRNYRSFHVKLNEDHSPSETRIAFRRQRVAEVHNQSKFLVAECDGDIVIGLEDDTDMSRLTSFERLYRPLEADQVGFVEGVEMGRWGANIVGAWVANDIDNPTQIETLLPPKPCTCPPDHMDPECDANLRPTMEQITGGGFYGYATRKHLYLSHDYYSSSDHPFGPDVVYGLYVRRQGYLCVIDWQTIFGHRDYNKTLFPDPQVKLTSIRYTKNIINGKWDREDYEQS